MLTSGLYYESMTVASTTNSAVAMGSGDMDVFATPSMVALMEKHRKILLLRVGR